MKVRSGFVSNSSSSSFVCDACGRSEAGYDGMYDIDVSRCENDHEWCSSHGSGMSLSLEDKQKTLLDYKYKDLCEDELELLKSGNKMYVEELYDDLKYEINEDGVCAKLCPVCSLNSMMEYTVLNYMLKKYNTTRDEVEDEIRSKFSNLDKLEEALK